jgi:hypothetical protein
MTRVLGRRWLLVALTCSMVTAGACSEPDGADAPTTTAVAAPPTTISVAATSTDGGGTSTRGTDAAQTVPATAIDLPDTPAAQQLRWVIDEALAAPDDAFPQHFSAAFLAQVPAAGIRAAIVEMEVSAVEEIVTSSATTLVLIVTGAPGRLAMTINVEAGQPHLITGLLSQPADLPASWEEVDAASADAAPRFTYLAAEVDDAGALTTIRTAGAVDSVPIGSGFKLYVLGALVQAIEAGEIRWDDELTITDALKSLPSGELQDRPAGSTVSVREAAEKMIQISDNTAADLLIDRLGRDAVEAVLTPMGMGSDSRQRTLPFLTTREMTTLKWGVSPSELESYIAADVAGRREILAGLGDRLPTVGDVEADVPVAIDDVEWFATPAEVASAHLWLDAYRDRQGFEPLAAVVGTNSYVRLDPTVWPESSFKGGSEPGLVLLGWLLHRADGRRFVVVVAASNPDAAIDELRVASISQGIIDLIGT